jgi:hypothetical protein
MLKTSHISNIQIYTQEWDDIRKGRFTSSKISEIIGDDGVTKSAGMGYIYQKAGEKITGKSMATEDDVIEDENTAWGREHEPAAIRKFGVTMGIEYLVTQKIILDPESNESSTPDAIWVHGQSILKSDEYNVSTLEVKCPRKYNRFIPLWECDTPEKLKKYSKKYYWQVLHQMRICDSAVGYFACYHPLFPQETNMRIIQFNKIDLWDDFKKMNNRISQANSIYIELLSKFYGA